MSNYDYGYDPITDRYGFRFGTPDNYSGAMDRQRYEMEMHRRQQENSYRFAGTAALGVPPIPMACLPPPEAKVYPSLKSGLSILRNEIEEWCGGVLD